MTPDQGSDGEFDRLASRPRQGLVFELWNFLVHYKKWWLMPIILVLLLVGVFVVVGGSSAAPLIYTLF